MLKRFLFALVVCGLASSVAAHADSVGISETFKLTVDGCTGGCGTGSTVFGTITLTQSAVGVVTISETLSGSAFVGTGAGNSLVFSLNGDPLFSTLTFGGLNPTLPTPPNWKTGSDGKDSPFADGDYFVSCDGLSCGPGASKTNPGPLTFTLTSTSAGGVNVSDFVPVDTCYKAKSTDPCEAIYFSSDVIGPSGKTGDVGALVGTTNPPSAPEPSSLMLLGTGALGLAGVVRRRFNR